MVVCPVTDVSNLERSKLFWKFLLEDNLGYSKFQEWGNGISWKHVYTYIVFVQTEGRFLYRPFHRKTTGINHLAFAVKTPEDVDTIASKLRERGHQILYQETHPYAGGERHYALFTEDPDRIKVEVVAMDV